MRGADCYIFERLDDIEGLIVVSPSPLFFFNSFIQILLVPMYFVYIDLYKYREYIHKSHGKKDITSWGLFAVDGLLFVILFSFYIYLTVDGICVLLYP